jgi:hypothetical protein
MYIWNRRPVNIRELDDEALARRATQRHAAGTRRRPEGVLRWAGRRVGIRLEVLAPDAGPLESLAFGAVRLQLVAFDLALPTRQAAWYCVSYRVERCGRGLGTCPGSWHRRLDAHSGGHSGASSRLPRGPDRWDDRAPPGRAGWIAMVRCGGDEGGRGRPDRDDVYGEVGRMYGGGQSCGVVAKVVVLKWSTGSPQSSEPHFPPFRVPTHPQLPRPRHPQSPIPNPPIPQSPRITSRGDSLVGCQQMPRSDLGGCPVLRRQKRERHGHDVAQGLDTSSRASARTSCFSAAQLWSYIRPLRTQLETNKPDIAACCAKRQGQASLERHGG